MKKKLERRKSWSAHTKFISVYRFWSYAENIADDIDVTSGTDDHWSWSQNPPINSRAAWLINLVGKTNCFGVVFPIHGLHFYVLTSTVHIQYLNNKIFSYRYHQILNAATQITLGSYSLESCKQKYNFSFIIVHSTHKKMDTLNKLKSFWNN